MFHATWRRSSFNSTSPVGKNTKITFVEECIFIEMIARTHWFQNHYWIVNVIFLQIVWNLTTSQIITNLVFCFFLLKQLEKKWSKWLIVQFKINVQERKLVHSNNRTVPNKARTYGKFGKKIISGKKQLHMYNYSVPKSNMVIYNRAWCYGVLLSLIFIYKKIIVSKLVCFAFSALNEKPIYPIIHVAVKITNILRPKTITNVVNQQM